MGEKIAKTGVKRDNDLMYYIKGGDVWATPRKKPGQPKGKAQKIATAGIEMDYSRYLYYLDGDGDVARRKRQVGGSKRRSVRGRGKDEGDKDETEGEERDEEDDDESDEDAADEDEGDGEIVSPFPDAPCSLNRDVHPKERCLRVDDYARALAAVLNASFGEFCFAVFGHWGRGKTFLIQRLVSTLPSSYRAIWFSAWKYRTTPETWIYLHETFVRAARQDGVLATVPRAVRAHMSRHGVWPIIVLLFMLAVAIFGLGLVPVLVGVLGVIGVLKAYAVSRWAKKIPPQLLSLPQHADKLGLQAAIGDDLTALVKGWIPVTRRPNGNSGHASLPAKRWLVPYIILVVVIFVIINDVLQGREYGFAPPLHPPGDAVRWAIVVSTTVLSIVLPFWVVYGGRGAERIALIVDDLDRCDPATMLDIIESLKLLLEDPEISARVQVVMLIEEESLHHAIEKRYLHIKDVRPRPALPQTDGVSTRGVPRAVSDTVEKLFLAHLRLPALDKDDLREVMRTYTQQFGLRDDYSEQPQQAASGVTTLTEPGVTSSVKVADNGSLATMLLFTAEERAALVDAVDELIAHADGRFLGPRSIRTFLTRYQLAKFLLATRKAGCSPHELVARLANPDPAILTYPDLDAVIAEVS
jgi:hypothetical protein